MIPFGKPIIGAEERAAVSTVLAGPTLTHGPTVREFEAAFATFTGAPHAIATANCMASLHLAYMAIGLGPGDEVLVPAQTHVAMAHAVAACGATPVFVDCEGRTGNVDIDALDDHVGERTRAISVVHFLGRPVDMEPVLEIARRDGLMVVEDCAIALGARTAGTHVGLLGDVGCFSFYPVKHITTGEGGMLITRRSDLAERISRQRAFGIDRGVVAERRHSAAYDVVDLGLNYRMGEVQAALGIEQLKRLPDFLARRRDNYRQLARGLSDLPGLRVLESDAEGASHYALTAILDRVPGERRSELIEELKRRGVGTSVYYPKPLPELDYYSRILRSDPGAYPEAARISYRSIAFPVGPHVEKNDVEAMIAAVREALEAVVAHA